jgi:Zn-dependent protease with chaperone function
VRQGPSLVSELIVSVPALLLGSVVLLSFGIALEHLLDLPRWLPLLVAVLTTPLLLLRPFEHLVVTLLPGLRHAQDGEYQHLARSLQRVYARHPFPRRRWVIAIEDGEQLNAATSGRHVLSFTESALQLPAPLLDAVVAHELSHQSAGDTVVKAFRWWFVLPVRLVVRVVRLGAWVAVAAGILGGVSVLIAVVLTGLMYVLLLPLTLLLPLNAAIERRNELAADRLAATSGFRDELVALLTLFLGTERRHSSRWSEMISTHPTVDVRLRALQEGVPADGEPRT